MPLRILYIGLKFDYGVPQRGYSFEHLNFFDTLEQMNDCDVTPFWFDEVMRSVGRMEMNRRLLEAVKEIKPEVCFFVLFTDEISQDTITEITEKSGAITLNWFGDDHWRFENYSRFWSPLFHWVVTTDSQAEEKYRKIGCQQVIKSQWGFNHHCYKRVEVPADLDVTFIGQVHSKRQEIVRFLQQEGVDVRCWGKGWDLGRLSQEEMVKTYSRSKINLNFTESSVGWQWKPIAKIFLNRRADGTVRLRSLRESFKYLQTLFELNPSQIKGRNFEIPGSGGFLLTSHADNLQDYFAIGKEIAVFSSTGDLVEKIRYYLSHDKEREEIRHAGHVRAIRDHTFEQRFRSIFKAIGLLSCV